MKTFYNPPPVMVLKLVDGSKVPVNCRTRIVPLDPGYIGLIYSLDYHRLGRTGLHTVGIWQEGKPTSLLGREGEDWTVCESP